MKKLFKILSFFGIVCLVIFFSVSTFFTMVTFELSNFLHKYSLIALEKCNKKAEKLYYENNL